ncbi:MAG: aa3-type cytochrome c oxidase subunit IV [Pseudomonadota bacterium]
MADYKPGDMDIAEQEATYDGFWKWIIRTLVIVGIVLLILAVVGT